VYSELKQYVLVPSFSSITYVPRSGTATSIW
jgi:hypothetical protein